MKILVLHEEPELADALAKLLHTYGHDALAAYTEDDAFEHATDIRFDLVMVYLGRTSALVLAAGIQEIQPDCRILLFAPAEAIESARAKRADFEYLEAPFQVDKLLQKVEGRAALDDMGDTAFHDYGSMGDEELRQFEEAYRKLEVPLPLDLQRELDSRALIEKGEDAGSLSPSSKNNEASNPGSVPDDPPSTGVDIGQPLPPPEGRARWSERLVNATTRYSFRYSGHTSAHTKFALSFLECWRRGWESNPRIKVLQTSPLPLGYRASTRLV